MNEPTADYSARYEGVNHYWYLPIVTHSANGVAMVYDKSGELVEAPSLPGFDEVRPNGLWIHKRTGK